MIKKIPYKTAGILLTVSLALLLIFHLLMAYGVLPQEIIWPETLSAEEVKTYELISAGITALLLFFTLIKARFIIIAALERIANGFAWITVLYSFLMVLEITSARSLTENLILIPLSIVLLVSSLRLAIEKR